VPTIDAHARNFDVAAGQAHETVQAKDQGRRGHTCHRATTRSSNLDSGPLPGGGRSSAAPSDADSTSPRPALSLCAARMEREKENVFPMEEEVSEVKKIRFGGA
jgi:hypothetical protein